MGIVAFAPYIDRTKCNTTPGGFMWSKTKKPRRRQESLKEELAATTVVTTERKAAVTLSTAYNWKEWTDAGD
jgi:hypothetical protein